MATADEAGASAEYSAPRSNPVVETGEPVTQREKSVADLPPLYRQRVNGRSSASTSTPADLRESPDGSVLVPASLAAATFNALVLYLTDQNRGSGGELKPEARALLHALNRAASSTSSFAPETPADAPATVMLGMGEVAALIGCTPQWARRLAARGDLPGAQRVGLVWLVPSTFLDAFRHEREEAPCGEAREAGEGGSRAAERADEQATERS